jgi:hypothetical protein
MRHLGHLFAALAALSTLALASASAHADGFLTKPSALPAAERATLERAIAVDKASHPARFAAVAGVQGHLPAGYAQRQNPIPEVSRELEALGPDALLPMLSAIAFDAPAAMGNNEAERQALAVGLVRAVGRLRDTRSAPVLRAVMESASKDGPVARYAAEGLGLLCDKVGAGSLTAHTGAADPLRLAAIHGLGECRTLESAKHLASLVQPGLDASTARALSVALGRLASPGAWRSLGPSATKTGEAVRALVADALFAGYVSNTGDARVDFHKGILIASPDDAAERIERARLGGDPQLHEFLDRLTRQLGRRQRR